MNNITITREDMKEIWWAWFVSNRHYWAYGLTYAKLQKHRSVIFHYKEIWFDLLDRHSMMEQFPWWSQSNDENYNHAIDKFAGNIAMVIMRNNP